MGCRPVRFRPVGASPFPLRRTALCSSGGDGAGSTLGDGLGLPRSRARRAPVRLPRCPLCGKAHCGCSLGRLASGSLRRAEKKVAGPGLEPTTLGSSTQHLNHSDTGPRCFEGFHFHSLECAWRFLQPGAGGGRRSAAAARATSNSPKSKWRSAALEGGSLERTPRRVLAAPRGALRTARCSTWGGAQCRFFSGCGGFHAGGWRGLHDAGSPTLVVWPSPAGMGVRSPLGCRMGFSAGPVALSRSRGPSSRNGLT